MGLEVWARHGAPSKMRSVVLTGLGGLLPGLAEVAISVPSSDTQHIQEAHLTIEHLICELVERKLFPAES